jgi:hypothetical protein
MINQVSVQINKASRMVTLRHPNAIDCVVYRKVLLRTATGGEVDMGGMPTLGGLGVLKNEDEPDFEYQVLGAAKLLVTSRFEGGDMVDREDGVVPEGPMQEALIEPITEGSFEPKKNDLVGAMPGGGVLIGFEIIGRPVSVNIYPYTPKYVIAPRDELHDLQPWTPPP